jgi:hypothetical protein
MFFPSFRKSYRRSRTDLRRLSLSIERRLEPPTGAMEPQSDDRPTQAEHDRQLLPRQPLPSNQRKNLAVRLAQSGVSTGDPTIDANIRRRRTGHVELSREPLGQCTTPTLAATVIRQHSPSHTEQPGSSFLAGWAAIKSPPQSRERLGDHLSRILRIPEATHDIARDRREQLAIKQLESIPSLAARRTSSHPDPLHGHHTHAHLLHVRLRRQRFRCNQPRKASEVNPEHWPSRASRDYERQSTLTRVRPVGPSGKPGKDGSEREQGYAYGQVQHGAGAEERRQDHTRRAAGVIAVRRRTRISD